MKTYSLILLLLCPVFVKAQSFGTTEKSIIVPFDTTLGRISSLSVLPNSRSDVYILYRQNYKNSDKIKFEYIKIEKDTFLYVEYDSLNESSILKQGRVYLSDSCVRIDTTSRCSDPNCTIVNTFIIHHCLPHKFGIWNEYYHTNVEMTGFYEADKREGIWYYNDYNTINSFDKNFVPDNRELLYRNDSLINSRHLNIVKSNNIDSLTKYLTKRFFKQFSDTYFAFTEKKIPDLFNYEILDLQPNHTFAYQKLENNTIVSENKGHWHLTLRHLILELNSGAILKYKLLNVTESLFLYENVED